MENSSWKAKKGKQKVTETAHKKKSTKSVKEDKLLKKEKSYRKGQRMRVTKKT
jgi:hypothetical protein